MSDNASAKINEKGNRKKVYTIVHGEDKSQNPPESAVTNVGGRFS